MGVLRQWVSIHRRGSIEAVQPMTRFGNCEQRCFSLKDIFVVFIRPFINELFVALENQQRSSYVSDRRPGEIRHME